MATVTDADREISASITVTLMGDYATANLKPKILSGDYDAYAHVAIVAAHREAAELRTIVLCDKWLAEQYGIHPLTVDWPRINAAAIMKGEDQ